MDIDKLNSLIKTIERIDCNTCILGHTSPLEKNDLLNYLRSIL